MNLTKFAILVSVFLFLETNLISQNIFVYNQQTGSPISDVVVFNNDKSVTGLTNELGIVINQLLDLPMNWE